MRRFSSERPEPSTRRTPPSGTPSVRSTAVTAAAPRALVPRAARLRAELLEQHLRGEVVALDAHVVDDLAERRASARTRAGSRRRASCRRARRGRRRRRPPAARCGRAAPRRARGSAAMPRPYCAAVDDQRRERRRFLDQVGRLPARDHSARVEVRLVADDAARHAPDAEGAHAARERRAGRRGDRVGSPNPFSTSSPRHVVPSSAPSPRTSVSIWNVGAEVVQRGEGEGELLGRGGQEALAAAFSAKTCRRSGGRSRRRRSGRRDVRDGQGLRQAGPASGAAARRGPGASSAAARAITAPRGVGLPCRPRWAARPMLPRSRAESIIVGDPSASLRMTDVNPIFAEIEALARRRDKPRALDEIEDTLTTGYAAALALEAERWRIERADHRASRRLARRGTSSCGGRRRWSSWRSGSARRTPTSARLRGVLDALRDRADAAPAARLPL